MEAFFVSFIQYLVIMIGLCIVGFLGGFIGKKLRDRKDAKAAASAEVITEKKDPEE